MNTAKLYQHQKRIVVSLFCLVAILLSSIRTIAQVSTVPSYHPVYEWLFQQRIKGYLPYYDYESLPHTRAQILEYLNELDGFDLDRISKRTKKSFLLEFDPVVLTYSTREKPQSLFDQDFKSSIDRLTSWIWSDREKHLYAWTGEPGYLVIDHGFGRRTMFVKDGQDNRKAPYILNQHWRSYGTLNDRIGYHLEYIRAVTVGDDWIFDYDGFYSFNWKHREGINPNRYHYEGYVTYTQGLVEASIGRGNLKEGIGRSENMMFSRSSIPLDWIRLKVGEQRLRYTFIHAKSTWRPRLSTLDTDPSIEIKNSPQRWVAYHELTVQPFPFFSFSGYEMINYSNRGAELAYLNLVNRYAFGEWELQDQDNGWFGATITIRPVKGVELATELSMDDLGEKSDIYSKKKYPATSRFGRRYSFHWASPWSSVFWGEYTRLDPFLYSHPYDLNAHTDKGVALGSQIGPNADRMEYGAELWVKGRTFLRMSYSQNRQGLNGYDEDGNLVFLAGANPNEGRDELVNNSHLFLDGDLHEWNRWHLQVSWEFKRAYVLRINVDIRDMKKGDQLKNRYIFWTDLVIGF